MPGTDSVTVFVADHAGATSTARRMAMWRGFMDKPFQ
jgi:hypothetical protein